MTRIALLSDTHNYLDPAIFKYIKPCDQVWHAGDIGTVALCNELKKHKPLVAVAGNIDGQDIRKEYPLEKNFKVEDIKVYMTHIGGHPDHYAKGIREKIEEFRPKLFICGHSHILRVIFDKKYNMLYVNPGAAGNYGIHTVKTMVRFIIEGSEIRDMQVIELGKM